MKISKKLFYFKYILDNSKTIHYYIVTRRGVEQLAARRAHNPEAVGSSPTPAIQFI